ncbi:DUF3313 family protein [Agaribacterium haliotis]|uniref:DUF3313 family protein n=1 Tax=Agaribacterium haliotis TaxID=2013869 RepID=UPI000BB5827D|nr:DUF3313 family protein [Agaribacterium haliotis]
MKRFYLFPIAVLSLTLIACASPKPELGKTIKDGPYAGMTEVNSTPFSVFYLRDGEDLSRFKAVKFDPLQLDNLELDTRRLEPRDRNKWEITDEDKQKMQQRFATRVDMAFPANGNIKLVNEDGPNVLAARFAFNKYMPNATQDRGNNRAIRGSVWTSGIGYLAIEAALYDSENGELVAYLADAREVGDQHQMRRNDSVNNSRYINLEIDSWLNKLKNTMGSLKSQQQQ